MRLKIAGSTVQLCLSAPSAPPGQPCGRSSAGRTPPCQGEGHGFESHRPLYLFMASWPSGKARVCKTLITGSNPVDASRSCSNGQLFVFIALYPIIVKAVLIQAGQEGVFAPFSNNPDAHRCVA